MSVTLKQIIEKNDSRLRNDLAKLCRNLWERMATMYDALGNYGELANIRILFDHSIVIKAPNGSALFITGWDLKENEMILYNNPKWLKGPIEIDTLIHVKAMQYCEEWVVARENEFFNR